MSQQMTWNGAACTEVFKLRMAARLKKELLMGRWFYLERPWVQSIELIRLMPIRQGAFNKQTKSVLGPS